jgi:hypothetical protein
MMGLLAGATSPAGRWLVAALVLLCLVTWARAERAGRHAAIERAAAAEEAVAGRELAIAALEGRMKDLAAQAARRETIVRTINAQPRTTACVATPAVRSLLDGLRQPGAGDAADGAAHMPARAGATGAGG